MDNGQYKPESKLIQRFFELSLDILCVVDFDGKFKVLNPAFDSILGHRTEELADRPFMDFVHVDDHPTTQAQMDSLLSGHEVIHFDNRYLCKDGTYKWLTWMAYPELSNKLIYAIARENTERVERFKQLKRERSDLINTVELTETELKTKEAQLHQAQRLESIGRLSGGIAHDFNNMLMAIIGYADLAMAHLDSNEKTKHYLQEVKKAGQRSASLTQQLLAFGRQQVLKPAHINLNTSISQIKEMLARIMGENITILTQLEPKLGITYVDPTQIDQVIMNLLVNARDAIKNRGTITIETHNVYLQESSLLGFQKHIVPGPYIQMIVSDDGIGMDEVTQSQIFDPFFTTKHEKKGTGLGLSIAHGIINQSGGAIMVYSEVGSGTCFKIILPRIEESEESSGILQSKKDVVGGSETVLLVEDEEIVRELAVCILEDLGYHVLSVSSAADALKIMDKKFVIDILITDVMMPNMTGPELVAQLEKSHPNLKVIFISGFSNNNIIGKGLIDKKSLFLQKPFGPDTLASKLREILDK